MRWLSAAALVGFDASVRSASARRFFCANTSRSSLVISAERYSSMELLILSSVSFLGSSNQRSTARGMRMLESETRAPKISTNWSMSISAPVSRR